MYRIAIDDRRAEGGPFVVYVRRNGSRLAVGVGADSHSLASAVRYALAEVRLRRRAGQFR